jgi:hypothetical protein
MMDFDYSKLSGSFSRLSKPAKRALIGHAIFSEKDLAQFRRADIAAFHGIGPAAFPILEVALGKLGLKFKPAEK